MNHAHAFLLLACLALASGCDRDTSSHRPPGSADAGTGHALGKVAATVRAKMVENNISLRVPDRKGKAEITPQGDLLIDGKAVAVNDAQRKLLLQYRAGIIEIAAAGTDIGMQGADFGIRAAGKALRGALSGNGDQVDEDIQADAREFERQARQICDHLPPLLEVQRKLVAQLPEFAPYAKMDQSDIDDCREDTADVDVAID